MRGTLDVGDGHVLAWETHGRIDGPAAVVLHGGPGSGCSPRHAALLDPTRYRIILVDQRGCGRSTPHAGEPTADLTANTTQHLIADLERLRRHLDVDRWLLFGMSWGTTLALAYALAHPSRITGMLLAGVTTTSAAEIEWITRGVGRFLPEAWARFSGHVPEAAADGDLVAAYRRRLVEGDAQLRDAAAEAWAAWEAALMGGAPHPRWRDAGFRLGFARLVTHYWHHRAWLADGALLEGVRQIGDIPAVLVQGRLDLQAPLTTAWQLHNAWPGSELVVVDTGGHDTHAPDLAGAITAASHRLAARLSLTPGAP